MEGLQLCTPGQDYLISAQAIVVGEQLQMRQSLDVT